MILRQIAAKRKNKQNRQSDRATRLMRRPRIEELEVRHLLASVSVAFQYQNTTGDPGANGVFALGYFPIRGAQVDIFDVQGRAVAPFIPAEGQQFTQPDGSITFTVPDGWLGNGHTLRFIVVAQSKPIQDANGLVNQGYAVMSAVGRAPTSSPVFDVSLDAMANDGKERTTGPQQISLAADTNADATFAIFDSLTTAFAFQAPVRKGISAQLKAIYPDTVGKWSTFSMPAGQGPTIKIITADGMSYDAVAHEYGHYLQVADNFATTVATGQEGHFFDQNLRYEPTDPLAWEGKNTGVKIAFSEGFADYFSVVSKTEGPGVGPASLGATVMEDLSGSTVTLEPAGTHSLYKGDGTRSTGEDSESSVQRILYQLQAGFVDTSGDLVPAPFTAAQIYNVVRSLGPDPTLNKLWDAITTKQTPPATAQRMLELGALFGAQNVAPIPISLPAGIGADGAPPTFQWTIPMVRDDVKVPKFMPANELDAFTLVFFSDDYTKTSLDKATN